MAAAAALLALPVGADDAAGPKADPAPVPAPAPASDAGVESDAAPNKRVPAFQRVRAWWVERRALRRAGGHDRGVPRRDSISLRLHAAVAAAALGGGGRLGCRPAKKKPLHSQSYRTHSLRGVVLLEAPRRRDSNSSVQGHRSPSHDCSGTVASGGGWCVLRLVGWGAPNRGSIRERAAIATDERYRFRGPLPAADGRSGGRPLRPPGVCAGHGQD